MPDGSNIELDKVLLIADGDKTSVGMPTITDAKVTATATGTVKGDKVVVLRYKPKVRYCKKTGQRQSYTQLAINKIVTSKRKKTKKATSTKV